jgi:hypothetical protein
VDGIRLLSKKCCGTLSLYMPDTNISPTPVAAQSKVWVCGRSRAGIAGSNPDGAMDVYLL